MKIGKREYALSPRYAFEALNLKAAAGKMTEEEQKANFFGMACQVVCDSLLTTGRKLGLWRGWRYRAFAGEHGIRILITNLTQAQIVAAYLEVLRLEGDEKKTILPAEWQ